MPAKWKKLITMTLVWLASEVVLNFLGLDNLADYGEFMFKRYETVSLMTFTYGE